MTFAVSSGVFLLLNKSKPQFQNVVVFGDSLSDQGNVFLHSNETFPLEPYYKGRFSNGRVWVELLAEELGLEPLQPSRLGGTNYAYGGARTGPGLKDGKPNIGEQIEEFLNDHKKADPKTLYILCGGGNDFLDGKFFYTISNLKKHIIDLVDAGAKHILIPNFPGLGRAPAFTHEIPDLLEESIVEVVDDQITKFIEFKLGKFLGRFRKKLFPTVKSSMAEIKAYLPQVVEDISKRIAAFMEEKSPTIDEIVEQAFTSANAISQMQNDHLNLMLDELERELRITFYRLDLYTIMEYVSEHPQKYDLTETYYPAIDTKAVQLKDNVDPNNHLFFDGLHPTHAAHQIFAESAYQLLQR